MTMSELLAAVTRPLSPDAWVPASRSEYEHVLETLEEGGVEYPTLEYDGFLKVAIISAAPSPLHGDMVGELLGRIYGSVTMMPGIDQNIKDGVSISTERTNTRGGDTSTTRNWDGALIYRAPEGKTLMVAVEVGLSQTYESLKAAISFSVCALRCRVGIVMSINEGHRCSVPTRLAAIQEIEHDLDSQLQPSPFGPLRIKEEIWFGRIAKVVLETYRLDDEPSPPDGAILDPKQSFVRKIGAGLGTNLAEITIRDCIPSHILTGNNIEATPVNFFQRNWFEKTFRDSMIDTAMERVWDRSRVQRV
ncbi:hypothetical protein V1509DRAFT_655677 [Lipomyces kononenkoae]